MQRPSLLRRFPLGCLIIRTIIRGSFPLGGTTLGWRTQSLLLPDGRLKLLFEFGDEFFVGGVDFRIREAAFGMAVGEGVSHAFLAGRDVLTAENVEEFGRFEV